MEYRGIFDGVQQEIGRDVTRMAATRKVNPDPVWQRIFALRKKVGRSFRFPQAEVMKILEIRDTPKQTTPIKMSIHGLTYIP